MSDNTPNNAPATAPTATAPGQVPTHYDTWRELIKTNPLAAGIFYEKHALIISRAIEARRRAK